MPRLIKTTKMIAAPGIATLPIRYIIQFSTRGKIVLQSKILHHSNNNFRPYFIWKTQLYWNASGMKISIG